VVAAAQQDPRRLHALEQKYGSLLKSQMMGGERQQKPASFSFRRGMQSLTDALASSIGRIETGVTVRRIEVGADGVWTVAGARGGEPVMRRAKAIVLATPAPEAAKLMRELWPAATRSLSAIEYAGIASVASAYRRDNIRHSLAGFGFLVPKKESRRILGSLFSSSMFEGRAPPNIVLLTTFVGGMRNPELPARSDGLLGTLVHEELAALVGATSPPIWTDITHWASAIPQYNLGHAGRLRPLEDAERARPGLFFCGSYRGGVSVGDCIKSAHATADAVTRFLIGVRPS
jgi:oxygen-dependent protoporphyrinogen oxidase